jgi:SAM-dependent methyltransferase
MEHEAYLEMAAVEDRHWWFRGRRAILQAVISHLDLPVQARILELGSGTGGNFLMLQHFGTVTAVELDETARQLSSFKTTAVTDIRAGSLPADLPLDGQKFDLICLFDVLEHVEDDAATLAVIHDCLAPGGSAVITVPAFAKLYGPHDVALHHKRRYGRAELAAKCRGVGLEVTKLTYTNMALFPLALLSRLADRLLRRRQSSGNRLPPSFLNEIFAAIFAAEHHVLNRINLPIGLSLLAVLRAAPFSPESPHKG